MVARNPITVKVCKWGCIVEGGVIMSESVREIERVGYGMRSLGEVLVDEGGFATSSYSGPSLIQIA